MRARPSKYGLEWKRPAERSKRNMKKAVVAAVIIGASALYVLMRAPSASLAGMLSDTDDAPQVAPTSPSGTIPPPLPTPGPTTPAPASSTDASASASATAPTGKYKDGTYAGSLADAFYGPLKVQAVITGGKLADVQFLSYPNDRGTSIEINRQAMPYLTQEAIAAQSANVDIVSGATQTSEAFRESLGSALAQAVHS